MTGGLPLVLAVVCMTIPATAQQVRDPNAAAAPNTGFVIADELPPLFRSFAPGARHDVTLNPARMALSDGFLVSSYRPNAPNPHVSVTLVTGSEASWLLSVSGNRMSAEATTTDHASTPPPNASSTDMLTKSLGSETEVEFRVVRLLPSSSTWHRAVGIRAGFERSDSNDLTELAASARSVANVADIQRNFGTSKSLDRFSNTSDASRLSGALELAFFNGGTDVVVVAGVDLLTVERSDVTTSEATSADTTVTILDERVVSRFERMASGTTADVGRPVFHLGTAIRALVAENGAARHYVTFQGGARYGVGSTELLEYDVNQRVATIAINGIVTLDGPQFDDSLTTGSFADPIERRIFAGGGYTHQQKVGRVELTTGVGIQTDFSLLRNTAAPDGSDYPLLRRRASQEIDWLVPAFVVYDITDAIALFAGAVFELSYSSSTTRFESTNSDISGGDERRDGTLGTAYHAGLVVDRAGFFGQIGFSGDLADYRGWRLTLGLDL